MSKKKINVALLGFGTVGSGVYEIIEKRQKDHLSQKAYSEISVKTVLVRSPSKYTDLVLDHTKLTDNWKDVIDDPSIDIVIEVMGGIEPAFSYVKESLLAGKNVVSANKDMIAVYGQEISKLARNVKKDFMFEAAALGAIPIVHPLMEGLSANNIFEIVGIMNGTTNYILSKMTSKGWDYEDALNKATELGYAESDPTADVEGFDAGRKVAILANLAFHVPALFEHVYTEGITKIKSVDIAYAKKLGCVIKLLGIATKNNNGVALRVHPTLVSAKHPLASVDDSFNAVYVRGDACDEAMFYGRGAGKLPTASAVVGDVIDICRNIAFGAESRVFTSLYDEATILPIDEVQSCFYVRLHVKDAAGVLALIGGSFGEANVSIAQVIQSTRDDEIGADLVIITHEVKEKNFNKAMLGIRNMNVVHEIESVIRVYGEIR